MKLNIEFKNILLLIIIVFITIYHYYVQHLSEVAFFKRHFDYNNVKRPLFKCKEKQDTDSTLCIGMPSGHAESITILSCLLYLYKFIPLWLCLIFIFIVSFQRIVSHMHTIIQVIIGILFGLCYVFLYKNLNLSIFSFLLVLSIGLSFKLLSLI